MICEARQLTQFKSWTISRCWIQKAMDVAIHLHGHGGTYLALEGNQRKLGVPNFMGAGEPEEARNQALIRA